MSEIDDPTEDRRPPRLTRGAGVFGVLALLVGLGGGFVAGQATSEDAGGALVATRGDDDAGPSSEPAGAVPATIVAGTSSADGGGAVPVPVPLFRRDTEAGWSVRVLRVDRDGAECDRSGAGCPPPECFPSAFVEAQVVGEWTIAQGGGPLFAPAPGDAARVLGTVSSWTGGDRVFGVVVATSPGVERVRLSLAGSADEMAPIDGLAVVVVPQASTDDRPVPDGLGVEVFAAGTSVHLDVDDAFAPDPACIPPSPAPAAPPSLPGAGEQPADVDTARGDVEAVFGRAFGGDDAQGNLDAVDDPEGLEELRERLRESYPEMLGGRVTYEITDVVFTSPSTAAFRFRPVIADYNEMPMQIGGAREVDGEWKITRATACAMFSLGGATC
jgi:hypothetical protein